MNPFKTILILAFAFLAVFGEATLSAPRSLLGAQIDLLPALMVYAALNSGLPTIALLAVSSPSGEPRQHARVATHAACSSPGSAFSAGVQSRL